MFLAAPPVPVLAVSGGAGSGKTTLANGIARALPGTRIVHLDHCFHTSPELAPVVAAVEGDGFVIDFSDPLSLDWDRVRDALDAGAGEDTRLLLIEGTFALLPALASVARWSVYVDTPADLRLARKLLRKAGEGVDPEISLRGYLAHGRDAHDRHVEPLRSTAGLVVDGTRPSGELVRQIVAMLGL